MAEQETTQAELEHEAQWIESLQEADRKAEAIAAEDAENMATVKAEIDAARGFLANLLDSPPDPELTLAQALADAAEWAHSEWQLYL